MANARRRLWASSVSVVTCAILAAGCGGTEQGTFDPGSQSDASIPDEGALPETSVGDTSIGSDSADDTAPPPDTSMPEDTGSETAVDAADTATDTAADAGVGAVGVLGASCATPGALACNGNNQSVQLICSGGVWALNGTCGPGQQCNSMPGLDQGKCAPILAECAGKEPGHPYCVGQDRMECGPDLVGSTKTETCAGVCLGGACVACSPGGKRCTGSTPQTCNAEGDWQDGTPCAGASPVCVAGACVPCSPGSKQCSGTTPQTCTAAGTWANETTCSGASPTCLAGACVSCSPGSKRCIGATTPQTCDATGSWQDDAACAGTSPVCLSGSCASCSPGAKRCSGATPQTCDGSGTWKDDAACSGALPACLAGACVACEPGTKRCDGNAQNLCSMTGTWLNLGTCTGGLPVCLAGSCVACAPGAKRCSGDVQQTCSAAGGWTSGSACSDTAQVFIAGSCTAPSCGDAIVSASAGEQCDDGNADACDGCESCERRRQLTLPAGAYAQSSSIAGALQVTGAACYEAWARIDPGAPGDAVYFSSASAPPNSHFLVRCFTAAKLLSFAVENGSPPVEVKVSRDCADGVFHHIAACREVSGSTVTLDLFWDGEKIGTASGPASKISPATTVVVGGLAYAKDGFGGRIDEIRISNVRRYTTNFAPQRRFAPDANTVAIWHLDEGSGLIAYDATTAGHDLVLSGTSWAIDDGYRPDVCGK